MHSSRVQLLHGPTRKLTPSIRRQRLVLEGDDDAPTSDEAQREYHSALSRAA